MCGFVAIYQPEGQSVDVALLEQMTHSLAHRGPDDFGFGYVSDEHAARWRNSPPSSMPGRGVAMGHRRLSIVDLSPGGRQPFVSHDERYWLVYNGEIYNYVELREQLRGLGHGFRTATDTEVVLCAYAEWGSDCFRRFNGMWGIVIWDRAERSLIACRDRFGEKPLYYHRTDRQWIFSSEIKAILVHPEVPRRPNRAAIVGYISRLEPPPPDASYFDNIHAVEPGTFLRIQNGVVSKQAYWLLPEAPWPRVSNVNEAASQLHELLTDSVRLRLRSDVQVGTMLSGGIDSTSVIAKICDLMKADARECSSVGDSLHAFTASFPGNAIDESGKVAEFCKGLPLTAHAVMPMKEQHLLPLLESVGHQLEMPFFNSVPIVLSMLMRSADSAGVRVVLNGHGADELFAGYPYEYCPLAALSAMHRLNFRRSIREVAAMRGNHDHPWRAIIGALKEQYSIPVKRLMGQEVTWTQEPLVYPELLRQYPTKLPDAPTRHGSVLDSKLRIDFFHRVLPTWLQLEDRMSMAFSIESRLPFLDYRLVEFAFGLADHLKINRATTKYTLRKAMAGALPASIVADQNKQRFSGPGAFWLRGPFRAVLQDLFLIDSPMIADYVDRAALAIEVRKFLNESPNHMSAQRMWMLFSTEMWMRQSFRGPRVRQFSQGGALV